MGGECPRGTCLLPHWVRAFFTSETFEEPLRFLPERWEKEENRSKVGIVDMMFSGGPRGCIGRNLALTEMRVLMIKLMQRYGSCE